jgi:hypothetical protein
MTRTLPRLAAVLGLAGLVLAVTACVQQSDLPSDCDASQVERTATLTDGGLDPDAFDICKGQEVTLTITVQVAGTLHLHGYDVELPETELHAGTVAHIGFTASRAGQFPLELHTGTDEIELAILTVHER